MIKDPNPDTLWKGENNPCSDPPNTQSAETKVKTILGGVYMHREMIVVMNVGSGVIRRMNAQN